MEQPDTQYTSRPDGVSIAYQVVGNGPVDLLFGAGFVSHLDFLWADPGFAACMERMTGFARVILFDKPGTGLSDPIAYVPTLEERAQDLLHVLDAAGAERAVLLGFSEAGPACVLCAAIAPERVQSLVLPGSFARFPPPGLASNGEALTRRRFEDLAARWGEGTLVDMVAPDIATPLERRLWGRYERAAASPSMLRALIEFLYHLDVREAARTVHAPALVLHMTEDFIPIEGGRELAALLPRARFVELPGRNHAFWTVDFEALVGEVEEFVTGTRNARPSNRQLISVLFTDIVDSTARAVALGDGPWRDILERHNEIVARHVERAGGRIVKFLGDGAFAAFAGPGAAVACAGELVAAVRRELDLEIRAGIHAGECETVGDDLAGVAVHVGARIGGLAAASEVLVSQTVRDLVVGSGLEFTDRGAHELKGLPGAWAVHALAGTAAASPVASEERLRRIGDGASLFIARRAPGVLRALGRATRRQAA